MPTEPDLRWRKGHAFHEFAEALNLPTDHIVSVVQNPAFGKALVVMFTPEQTEEVYAVVVERDDDGILRPSNTPHHIPNFFENLKRSLEADDDVLDDDDHIFHNPDGSDR